MRFDWGKIPFNGTLDDKMKFKDKLHFLYYNCKYYICILNLLFWRKKSSLGQSNADNWNKTIKLLLIWQGIQSLYLLLFYSTIFFYDLLGSYFSLHK